MRTLALLVCLLSSFYLPGQLILSSELFKRGVSNSLDVEVWGERYLIRTSDVTSLPLDFTDYLIFADEEGGEMNRSSLNPYAQESNHTTTDFTILTDSSAVALAGGGEGVRTSLIQFDRNGEVTLEREFINMGLFPYSLHSMGDSIIIFVELGIGDNHGNFTVRAVDAEFEDVYSLKFEEIEDGHLTFNTIHLQADGNLYVVYERRRDPPGEATDLKYFVAKVNGNGELLSTNQVSGLTVAPATFPRYTAILPVGDDGFALLEGFDSPDIACAGSACTPEEGFLRIYRDTISPSEVYSLNFSPFGMELLPDGNLFVYGATSLFGNNSKGVLFNPTGWPDGNHIHLLNDPNATGQDPVAYNRIYGMDVAANGDLVGTGEVGYGEVDRVERSHWLFRMGANGCFTADCSDLAEDPGNLVPTTNIENDLTIKTHPNPFTTILNFTTPDSRPNDPVTVSLHDLSGRLLRSGKLEGGLEWATEDLPAGMYVVTFTSGGKRGVVKVVKE